ASILAVMNVDMTGLASMDHARDGLAILALHVHQHRRAYSIEIPHVVGDVLEVADIFAGIEGKRNQRVRIEVIAGADRAVEVGGGIAHDKVDPVGGEIN